MAVGFDIGRRQYAVACCRVSGTGSDREVRVALFGERSRLPMVFQSSPLIHYLEVNTDSEVVTTVSRWACWRRASATTSMTRVAWPATSA